MLRYYQKDKNLMGQKPTWHSQWWGCRTLFQFQLLSQPLRLWQLQHQWTWLQCRCPERRRWSGRRVSRLQTGWLATGPEGGKRTTVNTKTEVTGWPGYCSYICLIRFLLHFTYTASWTDSGLFNPCFFSRSRTWSEMKKSMQPHVKT